VNEAKSLIDLAPFSENDHNLLALYEETHRVSWINEMKMARHIHPTAVEALAQGLSSQQLKRNYAGQYTQ